MKLLLDSHILLWTVFEPEKLSAETRSAIADTDNLVCISIASLWEIAIKRSIGCLTIPDEFFVKILKNSGFDLLLVQPLHVLHYMELPLYHRDPFDRMLVAQAQAEQLVLVTNDSAIQQYPVDVLEKTTAI